VRLTGSEMDIALHPATDDDRRFLVALYGSSRAEEMASWGWTGEQRQRFIAMQYAARCSQYDAVYPEREECIVTVQGVVGGLLSVARGAERISLVDIALLPEYRGRGVGRRLLLGLQQEATESGKTIRLHVLAENGAAVRFYQRLGFRCIGDGVYQQLEWRPETL